MNHRARFEHVSIFKRDYGFVISASTAALVTSLSVCPAVTLAKARNYLLSRALKEEDWVLGLDVDVIDYPPTF